MKYLKYFESNFNIEKDLFCKIDDYDKLEDIIRRIIPTSEDQSKKLKMTPYTNRAYMSLNRGIIRFKPKGYYMINPINPEKFGRGVGYWVIIPLMDEYFLLGKAESDVYGYATYSDGVEMFGTSERESKIGLSNMYYIDGYDGIKNAIKMLSTIT